ncbi:MAG: PAS domain S-box protein [Planctomycetes bacterium]|nr:PAS domain S-box protein [Planctomycetota bacterium]
MNDAMLALWGYESRAEVLGRHCTEFWATREGAENAVRSVLAKGSWHGTLQGRAKDGTLFQSDVTASLVRDARGEPQLMMASIIDVTEREQAVAALRESEARFRALVEQAADAIAVMSPQGRYIDCNEAACRLFGYSRAEFLALQVTDIIAPQFERAPDFAAVQPDRRLLAEFPLRRKDGSVFTAEVSATRLSNGTILGIIRDIEERRRSELALRESEAHFRELAETSDHVFWITELDPRRVVFVSASYEQVWGRPAQELKANPRAWLEAVHAQDRERVRARYDEWQHGGVEQLEVEFRIVRPDGQIRWILNSGALHHGRPGEAVRAAGIARDITARKEAELALAEREHRLSVIVQSLAVPLMISRVDSGLILFANQALADTVGSSPQAMIGRRTVEYYAAPDKRTNLMQELQAKRSLLGFELPLRHADGSTRWVLGSMTVTDYEGAPAVFTTAVDITERRQAQQARAEAERRLQGIVDSLTTPLMVTRASDGAILFANQPAAALIGIPLGEVKSRRSTEFYADPSDRESLMQSLRQSGEVRNYELAVRRATGEHRWVVFSACLSTFAGEPAVYASIVDITQRKAAEEALSESESRFRQLAESIDQVYWITDLQPEQVIYVSPAFERVWGIAQAQLYAAPRLWTQSIHPDDREAVHAAFENWIGGRLPAFDATYRVVRPDGSIRWVADRGARVHVQAGKPSRAYGVARDITAEREADQAYRVLVDHSLQGFVIFQHGRVVFANARLGEIVSRTPAELAAMAVPELLELVHADDRPKIAQRLQDMLTGLPVDAASEFRVSRPDGEWRHVATYTTRVEYRGALALQVAVLDVTEQRRLEDELHQTQKIESIGRLAGGIAHDFNNLLTVVLGFAEMMAAKAPKDSPLAGYAGNVLVAARRGADLTQQLLAFARKQIIVPRVVALNNVVNDVQPLLRRLIREDIELVTDLHEDAGNVRVDPSQFQQALLNLAANARDAMPEGGRLVIRTAPVQVDAPQPGGLPAGRFACIEVSDTGHGMTPQVQQHLVEPFFTTKGVGKGTGLGLASVHGPVNQSGGHISVDSEPGRGTRFVIHLPRVAAEAATT